MVSRAGSFSLKELCIQLRKIAGSGENAESIQQLEQISRLTFGKFAEYLPSVPTRKLVSCKDKGILRKFFVRATRNYLDYEPVTNNIITNSLAVEVVNPFQYGGIIFITFAILRLLYGSIKN